MQVNYIVAVVVAVLSVIGLLTSTYFQTLSDGLHAEKQLNAQLSSQLSELNRALATKLSELNELHIQLNNLNDDVFRYQKDLNYYRRNITSCRLDLRSCSSEVKGYQEELGTCLDELKGLESKVDSYAVELNSYQEELEEYKSDLSDCRDSRRSYRNSLSSSRQRYNVLDNYVGKLSDASPASPDTNEEMLYKLRRTVRTTIEDHRSRNSRPRIKICSQIPYANLGSCVSTGDNNVHIAVWYCDTVKENLTNYLTYLQNKRSELVSNGVFGSDAEVSNMIAQVEEFNRFDYKIFCKGVEKYRDKLSRRCL